MGLNSPQLSELKLGGRTSRSGRVSLQTSNPGAIPSDVAKFITKTNSKKSPKQNTATKSKQKEIEKSKTTDESSMDTTSESINLDSSFDNKENDSLGVEPDIIETSASSNLDEVKQESVVKEEYEFSSIVIQTKLEDRQIEESFSKSPSEDPQSEGEKGSRDYSDSDSALGSTTSFKNVNNNNENEKNCDWKVGDVVWGSFNRANWFPCMVYPIEDESDDDEEEVKKDDEEDNDKDNNPKPNTIRVKYFNYNGMVSDLPLKNLFKFTNLDAFYDQIKLIGSKKSKMKPFTKTCYRAIAEAEFFLKYPIEKRKELLDEIITMGKSKSRKSDIKKEDRKSERKSIDSAMDVASPAPMSPTNDSPNKNDPISDYIETMQRFDALNAIEFKKEKKERKSDVSKTDEVTVKKEEIVDDPDRRRSGRVVKKRKYEDFLQDDTIKPKPAEENKAKRPRLMKQLSLEERFSITPNDLRSVIKSTNKKRTCLECIENNNEPTYRCNGNGKTKCNGWYHEKCAGSVEHNEQKIRHTTGDSDDFIVITTKNTTLICQNCSNHNKNCFICSEKIVMENDKAEIFQCPTQDCRLAFHKHCIAQWPQTNGFSSKKQIFCPQHTCHTCFYKEVHNTGPLFKCIKCPSAYHVNVNCIPAGTKVLSQTQCICPRHPSAKELKSMKEVKPLNIDWCTMCMTSGNLVCCDYCPNAFHPECINYQEESEDEKYMCRECQEGRLPLYNTIVWTRVGTYRWWPGLIVTEAQARGTPRYEREFCLKFFGSNDHFWTSCERCYNYDGSTFMQKNGNSRLDNVFNLALEEAEEWSKVLQHQETDLSISKPKPYNKITVNRPIPPVKLKKCDDSMQACGCKGTDDDPCGPTSNCTNMHLNFECSKETCIAGDKCQNQKLRKREYAELKVSLNCKFIEIELVSILPFIRLSKLNHVDLEHSLVATWMKIRLSLNTSVNSLTQLK